MADNFMILPATENEDIRLIRIPLNYDEDEAYRHVAGLIEKSQEESDYEWDDMLDVLEEKGYESVDFVLGPSLD